MSRYIDANKAQDAIRKMRRALQMMDNTQSADKVLQGISLAEMEIEKLPSADVVEVVRCEHCLHWDDEKNGVYAGHFYHCCDYNGEHKEPCDFCSYGERREDG